MINLQRIHHIGMAVADIEKAQAQIGAAMGLTFAPVRSFSPLPFWTPGEGKHEVNVLATYSVEGPARIELVQGSGPFYDPDRAPDARHIGVWVDDVTAEAERLTAQGWTTIAAADAPENGWGIIAYLTPPIPGLLVELISTVLKPTIDEWLGES